MSALRESDLRLLLGDNYEKVMESDRTKAYKRLKKITPPRKKPNNITRIGAFILITVSLSSICSGVAIFTSYHNFNLLGTTIFSILASVLMLFNAYNVLIGLNYGSYRISGSICILTNTLFIFPLIALYFSNTAALVTEIVVIINLLGLITWFWDADDCID